MCDPLTLGSLAIGAAGTAANSIGQAKAQKKQESEYNAWAEMQRKNRANENARQASLRDSAIASQQKGVADLSAESQKAAQDVEATRLESALAGETPDTAGANAAAATADAAITGGEYGGDVYQEDFAKQLSDAMASAKDRTKALATMQSFGDSFGGLGVRNPIALGQSGAGIDEANFKRAGSQSAYGIEQAVDPTQISYSNPIADIASSFLGVGMQGLGAAAGGAGGGVSSIFGGKAMAPAVKVAPIPKSLGFGPGYIY
jgi:hypothetical protein